MDVLKKLFFICGVFIAVACSADVLFSENFDRKELPGWRSVDGKYWQTTTRSSHGSGAVQRVFFAGGKVPDKPAELVYTPLLKAPAGSFDFAVNCAGSSPSGVPLRQAVAFDFFSDSGKIIDSHEFAVTGDNAYFRRNIHHVNVPAEAKTMRLRLLAHNTAPLSQTMYVRFDDFLIADKISAAPKAKPNENTIDLEAIALDTTFENNAEGWRAPDGKTWRLSTSAHGGKYALQHIRFPQSSGATPSRASMPALARLPVQGGMKYHVSIFMRTSDSARRVSGELLLHVLNDAGKEIATLSGNRINIDSTRYSELSYLAAMPSGAVAVKPEIVLHFAGDPDKNIFTSIDDLRVAVWEDVKGAYAAKIYSQTKPTPIKLESPDGGKLTYGNLSAGKFYTVSRQPEFSMADRYPGRWTTGSKLTDGVRQQKENSFEKSLHLGWTGSTPVVVTLDLGRVQTLQKVLLSGAKEPEARFLPPVEIAVETAASAAGPWQTFAMWQNQGKKSADDGTYRITVSGKNTPCRFVRLTLTPDMSEKINLLLLDEIELSGLIKNSWKSVPADGAFHGAFPPSYGFREPLRQGRKNPMALPIFEKLVGKKVAMVLWYQGMSPERKFAEVQNYRTSDLAENFYGQRFLSLGWLPAKGVTLDDIISGKLDDYFYDYFRDSISDGATLGVNPPIWFRPMNEFNAGWVSWGLEPDKFIPAWRRMYNIAEQTGAAAHHIFVWSPNHRSYPDLPWNKMERYYPGDQYVDWVGVSCYPASLKYVRDENDRYVVGRCREVNEKYGHYKPMMIAEGGYSDTVNREKFVREWFDFRLTHPNFKAMIWENHLTRVIQDDVKALKAYREMVADPYWLSETFSNNKAEKK